jgi:hypothetical protein
MTAQGLGGRSEATGAGNPVLADGGASFGQSYRRAEIMWTTYSLVLRGRSVRFMKDVRYLKPLEQFWPNSYATTEVP